MSTNHPRGELYGIIVKMKKAQQLMEEAKTLAWELEPRFNSGEPLNDAITNLKTSIRNLEFAHQETNR